jgi:hypothetical protein
MSDLVERLRTSWAVEAQIDLHNEAADEIERLRARYDGALVEQHQQDGEIERLQAAGDAAFYAMCAYRDSPDKEVFQDAIDALGGALSVEGRRR